MFAVITAVQSELVEDLRFVKTSGALVTAANFLQIFPPALQAHKSILLGNTDYESTTGLATAIPLRPGNIYPESIREDHEIFFTVRRGQIKSKDGVEV
jgi:hypothetical protein